MNLLSQAPSKEALNGFEGKGKEWVLSLEPEII
jgi:hypothetical protein